MADMATDPTDIARSYWFWCCCLCNSLSLCSLCAEFGIQLCLPCSECLTTHGLSFASVWSKQFPVVGGQTNCKHVSLADIPEAWFRSANRLTPKSQLATLDVFWDLPIISSLDMAQPPQCTMSEDGLHQGNTCSIMYGTVGNLIHPWNAQDVVEASHVEGVKVLLLLSIGGPGLTVLF